MRVRKYSNSSGLSELMNDLTAHPENPSIGKQRTMGELLFLLIRSGEYARIPIGRFHDLFEPAIDHQQVQIFRFDNVPRGALLWAKFSKEAEQRFLTGDPLSHADWNSGDRLWIVSFLAPYPKMASYMVRWIRKGKNLPGRKFSHLRMVPNTARIRSVIEIDMDGTPGMRYQAMGFDAYKSRPANLNSD